MTPTEEVFQVDSRSFDRYLNLFMQRRAIIAWVLFTVILVLFSLVIIQLDSSFPVLLFSIGTSFIFIISFVWSQKRLKKTLLKFRDANFSVDSEGIKMTGTLLKERKIPLEQIALVDQTSKGAIIVKGNFWSKVEYYRPKVSGSTLDSPDRIFIPRVTVKYENLVSRIKMHLKAGN
ncbi:hypothetical protein [Halocola ammonii]